jgi:hypothetical protein
MEGVYIPSLDCGYDPNQGSFANVSGGHITDAAVLMAPISDCATAPISARLEIINSRVIQHIDIPQVASPRNGSSGWPPQPFEAHILGKIGAISSQYRGGANTCLRSIEGEQTHASGGRDGKTHCVSLDPTLPLNPAPHRAALLPNCHRAGKPRWGTYLWEGVWHGNASVGVLFPWWPAPATKGELRTRLAHP